MKIFWLALASIVLIFLVYRLKKFGKNLIKSKQDEVASLEKKLAEIERKLEK